MTDTAELLTLSNQLKKNFPWVRKVFNAQDSTGYGRISKPGFQKVLVTLLGPLDGTQLRFLFDHFYVNQAGGIDFASFVRKLQHPDLVKLRKSWIPSITTGANNSLTQTALTHDDCCCLDEHHCFLRREQPQTFLENLRQFALNNEQELKNVIKSVIGQSGRVFPYHFREILQRYNLRPNEEQFHRLWRRLDPTFTGKLPLNKFYWAIGFRAKPKTVPLLEKRHTTLEATGLTNESGGIRDTDKLKRAKSDLTGMNSTPEFKSLPLAPLPVPKLDKIIDTVRFKIEEPYYRLRLALRQCDYQDNGFVHRRDLRRVLALYGIALAASDLSVFLTRCQVKFVREQVNRDELLTKYMTRSENGIVHRILVDPMHTIHTPVNNRERNIDGTMALETAEASMVEFLHSGFLQLLANFKAADPSNTGYVDVSVLRSVVTKCLGTIQFSEKQWQELIDFAKMLGEKSANENTINYLAFLETLNGKPESWNHKIHMGFEVTQFNNIEPPAEVLELRRERTEYEMAIRRRQAQENGTDKPVNSNVSNEKTASLSARSPKELLRDAHRVFDQLLELLLKRFGKFQAILESMDVKRNKEVKVETLFTILDKFGLQPSLPVVRTLWEKILALPTNGVISFFDFLSICQTQKNRLERSKDAPANAVDKGSSGAMDDPATSVSLDDATALKTQNVHGEQLEELQRRIRIAVIKNWDFIKRELKRMDPNGQCYVRPDQFEALLALPKIGSFSHTEAQAIIEPYLMVSPGLDDEAFHYMPFLEKYASRRSITLQTQNLPLFKRIRSVLKQKVEPGADGFKHMFRELRRHDVQRTGTVPIGTFRSVMKSFDVQLSTEELYQVLTHFQVQLNGFINYALFVHVCAKAGIDR